MRTKMITRALKPPDLPPILADGGAGVVPIVSPGWVTKMEDEITVVRGHPIAETDLANGLPVSNGLPLTVGKENEARSFAPIRYGYVKVECAFGLGVTFVEDMGQDFMANIFLVDCRMPGTSF